MNDRFSSIQASPAFAAQPAASIVLDRELLIRAVNPAYTALSGRAPEELLGEYVFDAFPDNAEDSSCDGVNRLEESFSRVLQTKAQHNMIIQRYDVQDCDGVFHQRWWAPVNAPLRDGRQTVGILHQVQEVTAAHDAIQRVLTLLRDQAGERMDGGDDGRYAEIAEMHITLAQRYSALVDEVAGLRRALTSRATIDQAKGVLMAQHGCDSEQAFRLLVRLSQNTNVPLADVAHAVTYQTHGAGSSLRKAHQPSAPSSGARR